MPGTTPVRRSSKVRDDEEDPWRAAVSVESGAVRVVEDRPESVAERPTDADGTLVAVPGAPGDHSDPARRGLLTLSDVMATGHHAPAWPRSARRCVDTLAGDPARRIASRMPVPRHGLAEAVPSTASPLEGGGVSETFGCP